MTSQHIEIADKYLKLLIDNNYQSNSDEYFLKFPNESITLQDFFFVQDQLIALDLVEFMDKSKSRIMLTIKGEVASNQGMQKYLESELKYIPLKPAPKKHLRLYYLFIFTITITMGILFGIILYHFVK